jgi:phage terminase large subunit-like protein
LNPFEGEPLKLYAESLVRAATQRSIGFVVAEVVPLSGVAEVPLLFAV